MNEPKRNQEHRRRIIDDDLRALYALLHQHTVQGYSRDPLTRQALGQEENRRITQTEYLRLARLIVYMSVELGLRPMERWR